VAVRAPQTETPPRGLDAAEVAERVAAGLTNEARQVTSRTIPQILRANVFTRINAILITMFALILVFGDIRDGLFATAVIANSIIGTVQEIRAKRTLDRLAVLNAPIARAVRDGQVVELAVEEVVLDDLLELRAGDQIPADGVVRASDGLEVDESLLTGESEPVAKRLDDEVLSGSFVVAGSGRVQATRVGEDAYAHRLATEARRFALVHSELVAGLNRILRFVTWVLLVVGPLLFLQQVRTKAFAEAVSGAVAGVVGMVPEGLVLLTNVAFGVAAVTLARRKVLVQELPAVEGLARVDVVCLDKTGTITEGAIAFDRLEPADGADPDRLAAALGALADDPNANATLAAIGAAFAAPGWRRDGAVPFSSARKWSAAHFEGEGTWVLGAPEMVWPDADHPVRRRADALAAGGERVLLLARSARRPVGESLPADLHPEGLVVLEERVRPDAADTLAYFAAQGVACKVISGDNPRTVGAVAARVGLPGADEPVDARRLPEDPAALAEVMERHSVFGRVDPHQKRAMVRALQSRGHVVAMTGDGVNDALALKDADIGVAMGSGAAATRAVAQLVLLDGRFATMPGVVAEGRRVIANMERVANFFLTKTVYAALLAVATVLSGWPYPFLPRHLTVVSTLTIGVPAFFLALAPNARRYVPGFVERVMRFTLPAGAVAATAVFAVFAVGRAVGAPLVEQRTGATIALGAMGLWVLVLLARPLNWWRALLVGAMVLGFVLVLAVPAAREFFAFAVPPAPVPAAAAATVTGACALLSVAFRFAQRRNRPGLTPPR
jgi:cation-transporting ATPase E